MKKILPLKSTGHVAPQTARPEVQDQQSPPDIDDVLASLEGYGEHLGKASESTEEEQDIHRRYTRSTVGNLSQYQIVKHTIEVARRIHCPVHQIIPDAATLNSYLALSNLPASDKTVTCLQVIQGLHKVGAKDGLVAFCDKALGVVPHKPNLDSLLSPDNPIGFEALKATLLRQFQAARDARQEFAFFRNAFEGNTPCYEARSQALIDFKPVSTDTLDRLRSRFIPEINKNPFNAPLLNQLYISYQSIKASDYIATKSKVPLHEISSEQVQAALQNDGDKRSFSFNNRHDFLMLLREIVFSDTNPNPPSHEVFDHCVTNWLAGEALDNFRTNGISLRVLALNKYGRKRSGAGLGFELREITQKGGYPFRSTTVIKEGLPILQCSHYAWARASGIFYLRGDDYADPVLMGKYNLGSDREKEILKGNACKNALIDAPSQEAVRSALQQWGVRFDGLQTREQVQQKQQEYADRKSSKDPHSTKHRLKDFAQELHSKHPEHFDLDGPGMARLATLLDCAYNHRGNQALILLTQFKRHSIETLQNKSGFDQIQVTLRALGLEETDEGLKTLATLLDSVKSPHHKEFELTLKHKLLHKTNEELTAYFDRASHRDLDFKYQIYIPRNEMMIAPHPSQIGGIYVRCCTEGIAQAKEMLDIYHKKYGITLPLFTYDPLSGTLTQVLSLDELKQDHKRLLTRIKKIVDTDSETVLTTIDLCIPDYDANRELIRLCLTRKKWDAIRKMLNSEQRYQLLIDSITASADLDRERLQFLRSCLEEDHSNAIKTAALSSLLALSGTGHSNKLLIEANITPLLIQYLREGTSSQKEYAVGCLTNLLGSTNSPHNTLDPNSIIPDLISLLKEGNETQKEYSLLCLANLAYGRTSTRQAISKTDAFTEVSNILKNGSDTQKRLALRFFDNMLAFCWRYHEEIAFSGAIPHLISLVRNGRGDIKSHSAWLLGALAEKGPLNKGAILNAGAVRGLKSLILKGSNAQIRDALACLIELLRNPGKVTQNEVQLETIRAFHEPNDALIKKLVNKTSSKDRALANQSHGVIDLLWWISPRSRKSISTAKQDLQRRLRSRRVVPT